MQELARLRPSISEPKHKAEPQSHCFHSSGATVAVAAGGCCTDWHPDKHQPLKLVCGAPVASLQERGKA